jgi:hypothetical protein
MKKCVESSVLDELEKEILRSQDPELARERNRIWWRLWKEAGCPIPEEVAERLVKVNERLEQLSVEVVEKAWRLKLHIDKEVKAGNKDFEHYDLVGEVMMEEFLELGHRLLDELLNWEDGYCNCLLSGKSTVTDRDDLLELERENWDYCHGDVRLVGERCHMRVCRAFERSFREEGLLTLDDLALVEPGQINEYIKICI